MLPVVDTNWTPAQRDTAGEFHTLRAVAVQPAMPHDDALAHLQALCDHAQTPGLGGLPHGIVVYHELSTHDNDARLQALLSNDRVRGVALALTPDTHASIETLCTSLQVLSDRRLLVEFAGDIDCIVAAAGALHAVQMPMVCNISQCTTDNKSIDPVHWEDAMGQLLNNPLVSVKLCDLPASLSEEALGLLICGLVDVFGVEKLVFGGSGSSTSKAQHPDCWQRFNSAVQWASASDRDLLFRQNAIRLYRL